jgi:hypothetical protein
MWSGTGHGPTPHPDMIVMTGQWMSVPNFYTVKGLEILGELAAAAGRTADAEKCVREAAALRASIIKHMWDPAAKRFCDGICADPRVAGNHSIYSDMYSLWLGLVPDGDGSGGGSESDAGVSGTTGSNVESVWKSTTSWVRKTAPFPKSSFRLFVPSLSWQTNHRFSI